MPAAVLAAAAGAAGPAVVLAVGRLAAAVAGPEHPGWFAVSERGRLRWLGIRVSNSKSQGDYSQQPAAVAVGAVPVEPAPAPGPDQFVDSARDAAVDAA